MANRPIPVAQAQLMIKSYDTYMRTLGVDMKTQTHSVGFTLPELLEWLNKISPMADEIRICMGDYPDGHEQANRTTVILWPYKNGEPAKYPKDDPKESEGDEDDEECGEGGDGGEGGENGGGEDGDDCGNGDDDPGSDIDPYNDGTLYP